ncbi:hypothetical protein [Actinokineospora inagensis]
MQDGTWPAARDRADEVTGLLAGLGVRHRVRSARAEPSAAGAEFPWRTSR